MAISVGSVEVDIIPNTKGIYTKLKEALVPAATDAGKDAGEAAGEAFGPAMRAKVGDIGLSIGEQIGQQIANRIKDAVKDALKDGVTIGGQKAKVAGAKQGEETGGAFGRAMKARLEAAFKSLPKARIGIDETGVDADLARLRARMETLAGKRIGVDVDVAAANAEIADIEARLRLLGESHPNVAVRADTAAARAQLIEIRSTIDAITADPATVRIEADGSFGTRMRAAVAEAQAALPDIEVGANTRPAVAEMQALRADLALLSDQRVGIDIDAATALTTINDLQARLVALGESTPDVDVRVDAARAAASLAGLQAQVDALDATPATVHVDADVDRAGALAQRLRGQLEAAFRALPQPEIGLGTAGVDAGIARVRARLEQLASRTIGVDISVADADAKLALLEGQLERLGAASPNIAVTADAAEARATLLGIREEIAALTGPPATVRIEADGAFGAKLRATVAGAQAALPDIDVDANTRPAAAAIQAVRADLALLAAQRVGIDIDATTALANINALQARLAVLSESGDVDVRVDAARAAAALAGLQAQVDALDETPAVVQVDVDIDRAGAAAAKLRTKLEGLFRTLPKLDVGLGDEGVDAGIVRIRAKLEQLAAKTIGVDVSAEDAEAKLALLEAQLQRLGAAHPNVTVRADVLAALAQLKTVREEVKRLSVDPAHVRVETDGEFGAKLRKKVLEAQASLPDINIQTRVDTTSADLEVAHLRAELSALLDQRIGIDIDAATATAKIDDIHARLKRLAASDADVAVRVDSAAAMAHLAEIQATVSALDGKEARIHINTSGARNSMLHLAVAVASIGAMPAIPALVAALGAVVSMATAAAVGVGAIAAVAAPAFAGIAGALQAQKAAQEAATNASSRGGQANGQAASKALQLAGAQQALASAHRNAARQIAQAEQGVTDAVRQAAEAGRNAAQQVRQARQGLADAYQQAADRMRSANEQVSQAERSLADAQDAARQAQEDLTQARRDAAVELEDLSNRLADAQLSERDAALSVQEAQARLRATQAAGSKATELERQRAQLAYDQAVQRLKEQRQETAQTAAEKAAADKAGVEGSDRVKSAQERLAAAQQAVKDQAAGLAKAQRAAARQQIQNTKDIAAAQEKVAEAQRNVTKVQEDGARSVERAQESLVAAQQSAADSISSAQRQIKSAMLSTAGGVDQAAIAQQKYQEKLAKLTPAARGTFDAFVDLKKAFSAWSKSLQPAVMPIFTRALKGMKNALPGLTPLVKGAADGIKELQDRASAGFKKPWWQEFKKDLAANIKPAIVGLGISFGNVFKGMTGIVDAFLPHMDTISEKMQKVTGKFANWGTGLKGSPAFERFLAYSAEMGPKVAGAIKKIAKAFLSIAEALAPIDGPLLALIGGIADSVASLAKDSPWAIQGLFGIWAAMKLVNAVSKANPLGLIVLALFGLAVAVKYAWDHWGWFRDAILTGWVYIKAAFQVGWAVIGPLLALMWSGIKKLGEIVKWIWVHLVKPGIDLFVGGFQWMYDVLVGHSIIPDLVRAATGWFRTLKRVIGEIWSGIKTSLRVAWGGIKAIWDGLRRYIFGPLASAFRWFRDKVVKPVWDGISGTIGKIWRTGIRPVFNTIKDAIGLVADAFRDARDAIGEAWGKIKDLTKKPVNWVLKHVWNEGIVSVWKKITGWIPGVPQLGKVDYLAQGGTLRGPQPGIYNQPTAIVGEGNSRWPEYVIPTDPKYRSRAVGLHQAAGAQLLAKGGVIGDVWDGISDVGSAVGNFFKNPIKSVGNLLNPLLDKGKHLKNSTFGKMVLGLPRMAIKGLKSLASSAISKLFGGGSERVVGALKWARSQAGMPYQWGGAGNPSWDCSGFMSGIQKVIQGKNPKGRLWSTFSFQGRSAPKGWVKDLTAPFMIGITNRGKGHTAGTLAGVNVESRGGDGVVVGKRARGARDPFFDSIYGFQPSINPIGGSATREAAQATARQMMGEFGFSQKQWPALKKLWEHESGWRYNAQNPMSAAYGIPQANPGRKMASVGADWMTNPTTQIKWGLGYIKSRYGSPAHAWDVWQSRFPHWYDQGGYLQPGLNLAYNGTGRPEPVFTSAQANALMRLGTDPAAGLGDLNVAVYVGDREITDIARAEVRRNNGELVSKLLANRTG